MGVPKFFRYVSERYPCLSELVRMHQVPDFDNLYLDMNGIVHNCTHPDDSKVNQKITEEMMFLSIFSYIEYLFQVIKPRKLFFLAIDGVAPRAKMNQQRSRRFRSAKEMEVRENAARAKGEVIEEEFRFDSNCITPGTEFMVRLHSALQFFIQRQISTNESWQGCQVILSGHDTPGEGEHKIMDYIRYMKSRPGYDSNTTHCLYGLDADLIMLGCVTHEAHISLLREEVKFGKNNTKSNCVENTRFFLLHLGILKEYLELEFSAVRHKVSFGYDMDKIVDDWILLSFLVGNDFVPNLPNLHINENALPILYNAYMDVLPSLGGYMNEDGILNLPRFQTFLERLALEDRKLFKEKNGETRYMGGNMEAFEDFRENELGVVSDELAAFVAASEQMVMDDILDGDETEETIFEKEFQMCRRDYYITKMHFPDQDNKAYTTALRNEVRHYISAIQWILHYYYRGVPSWSWYYPSHYAPYISDITDILSFESAFELGHPFLPFQQLLGVLPPNSKDLLPAAYTALMLSPTSELIDFYPANFETDMNGKKQDWEALVLIPFIDEKKLLAAMAKCEHQLKDSERNRNKHGPMSVYKFTIENTGPVEGIMKLTGLQNSYCTSKSVALADVLIPTSKMVFGPAKEALTGVHFPGFPTMKFLDYTGKLASLRVRVFEMPSNNDTMEVSVCQPMEERVKTVAEIHKELMDTEIFVGWPHLTHAKVVGVSDENTYLGIHASTLSDHEIKKFSSYAKDIKDHHLKRMGIQLGPIKILIHVHLVKAREYAMASNGKLVLKTEWDNVKFVYPYQTIVRNLSIYNKDYSMYKTVDEVYKKDTKVFLLSTKYYGCMGRVLDTSMLSTTKRIQITIDVHMEPNLTDAMRLHSETKLQARNNFFNMYAACSQIGISKHALNRITGNFFVFSGARRQVNERTADKVNIGLKMRLPKDNKEIPGISKSMDSGWFLSADAVSIICDYLDQFPSLCDALAKPDNNIFEDDLNSDPEIAPGSYLREISKFADTLPHNKIRARKMGTEYVDPGVAAAVELAVEKTRQEVAFKTIKLQTKLHLLFLPRTTIKCPDPGSTFALFDRVILATNNLSAPIGTKGTIVSIFTEKDENPLKYENKNVTTCMYEVLFDEAVPNGDSYFDSIGEGKMMTVTEQSIINITYGRNLAKVRVEKDLAESTVSNVENIKPVNIQPVQTTKTVPQSNKMPPPVAAANTTTSDEKNTKEMLNHIWNSLKANPVQLPGMPSVVTATTPTNAPLDLTESLRKCLKIAGNENKSNDAAPVIQQPAPAQLPPPPANWRIEAQIKHLKATQQPHAMSSVHQPTVQMVQQQQQQQHQPQPPVNMFVHHHYPPQQQHPLPHHMMPQQLRFPMQRHPMEHMQMQQQQQPPQNQGPIIMPGFRPVATMPFNHPAGYPPPFAMGRGYSAQQRNFRPPPNRIAGPQDLRNTNTVSGPGAFIPLQAARKIAKAKNNSGNALEERNTTNGASNSKANEDRTSDTTTTSQTKCNDNKPKTEDEVKKAPVKKTKPTSAPRAARIAANFSVQE